MKHLKKILALVLIALTIMAVALPAMAAPRCAAPCNNTMRLDHYGSPQKTGVQKAANHDGHGCTKQQARATAYYYCQACNPYGALFFFTETHQGYVWACNPSRFIWGTY